MLARLQRATTLAFVVAAALWAAVCFRSGVPERAPLGAALMVLGLALVLGVECALSIRVSRGDPAMLPVGAAQFMGAWWQEIVWALRVFCWQQPFRSAALPDHVPEATAQPGLLLVHGFACNRGIWNPWMRRLRERGAPFVAVSLEPVFGSIDQCVDIVERAVQRLEAATGLPPVIVAHSMGGLVVRAWFAKYGADARVARVITVASPHHGTWLARFAFSRNGRQMQQRSAWFAQLEAQEPAARFGRFTCFYSHCDNVVFPVSTAMLPGADNRHVAGAAHIDLLFRPPVYAEAMRWLSDDGRRAGGG